MATDINDLSDIHHMALRWSQVRSKKERTKPVNQVILNWLREATKEHDIPLLIEADGSRQTPLKAPSTHEPPIPDFTDTVIVVAGLSALGKPSLMNSSIAPKYFLNSVNYKSTNPSRQALTHFLVHPQGGLKNIPPTTRRIILLNQADTPELQSVGGGMARELLNHYDSVIVGHWNTNNISNI